MGLPFDRPAQRRRLPADLWATNGGVYVGKIVEQPHNAHRPLKGKERGLPLDPAHRLQSTWQPTGGDHLYVGEKHLCLVGPNASGKSRKILWPNLYRLTHWTCVVADPKGESCAHTAAHRAATPGHRVMVVDPFKVMENKYPRLFASRPDLFTSRRVNPLASLNPDSPDFVDDAKALAVALFKIDDTSNPYWVQSAQGMAKGLLMSLAVEYGAEASLSDFRDLLGLPPKDFARLCKMQIDKFGARFPAIKASLARFAEYNPDSREIASIISTAITHTDWLDSPRMRANLQGAAFDFASIKTQPTTIYLVVPPKHLATHGLWLRLLVTSILLPLLDSVEGASVPTLFMLDEFAQLGNMEVILNNYALMRGYGVKLWTIWQGLDQAKRIYGEGWETFVGNGGILQSFGPQDLVTRDYLSKYSGERTNIYTVTSTSTTTSSGSSGGHHINTWSNQNSTSFNHSTSEQRVNEPVMKPHELAALERDETVLFWSGRYFLSACPQPDILLSSHAPLAAARSEIEGTSLPCKTPIPT